MHPSPKIVIVGAGVIGCSIAYYLSKQHATVTVLERGEIGGQASGAAAGLFSSWKPLAKMDAHNHLLSASHTLFPRMVAELEAVTNIQIEYEQTGTLRTIQHEKRMRKLQPWVAACQARGMQVELLNEEETRRREPLLSADICGALWLPSEGQVRAPRVVEALASAAREHGAVFLTHTEVVDVQKKHNRVIGVSTAQGEIIPCDYLVMATGAWAASCGKWLNLTLPVAPQRGQLLSLRQPTPFVRHIVIGKGIYIAPKQDGTVIVGATSEEAGFEVQVTAGGVFWLLDWTLQLMPALQQCAIERIWAGLRPKTPDGYPILGLVPSWENVALAVGHHSYGILLSAITGQAIAQLVLEGQAPEMIKPFSLQRFASQESERISPSAVDEQVDGAQEEETNTGQPE